MQAGQPVVIKKNIAFLFTTRKTREEITKQTIHTAPQNVMGASTGLILGLAEDQNWGKNS